MPKPKSTTKQSANGDVAAALAHISDSAEKMARHHDVVKEHIRTLEEANDELETQLAEEKSAHENTARTAKERLERETTALIVQINAREEKLRKVLATLA